MYFSVINDVSFLINTIIFQHIRLIKYLISMLVTCQYHRGTINSVISAFLSNFFFLLYLNYVFLIYKYDIYLLSLFFRSDKLDKKKHDIKHVFWNKLLILTMVLNNFVYQFLVQNIVVFWISYLTICSIIPFNHEFCSK